VCVVFCVTGWGYLSLMALLVCCGVSVAVPVLGHSCGTWLVRFVVVCGLG